MKRLFSVCFVLCLTAAAAFLLCACGRREAPSVPTVRSEALLEIFRLLDMKAYRAALPKIESYQAMDETNTFLGEMLNIVRVNATIQDAEARIREGDLPGAVRVIEKAESMYGNLPGLEKAKDDCRKIIAMRDRIRILRQPCVSEVMKKEAQILLSEAGKVRSRVIQQFARQKLADSNVLARLQYDRAGFLIYADAQDALDRGDLSGAMALSALLASEMKFSPAVQRLNHGGMYSFSGRIPSPDAGKETSRVQDPENAKP